MKILFLHLSDLHINTNNAYSEFHLKKLVDTLRVGGHFDKMVCIISGDIAQSGDKHQYNIARSSIIKIFRLMKEEKVYNTHVDIICVPGNHDIHFEETPRTSEDLNNIFKNFSYSKYIDEELSKQENFLKFANKYHCFENKRLFDRKILNYDGYKIEVNMINSAVFSLRNDEDKGMHYINQSDINCLNTPTNANFVISVMHHSPDWFIDTQKNQLEDALLCKSSLVFMGHEHTGKTKTSSFNKQASTYIHTGGALCYDSDWSTSEFEYGLFNTETNEYKAYIFKWNDVEKQYEIKDKTETTLPDKPSVEKTISVTKDYINSLNQDSHTFFSDNPMDYFVFPRLECENYGDSNVGEYTTSEDFIKEINDQKKVLIIGSNSSGKTFLLKHLFFTFIQQRKCVLFCDINTIKNKDSSKIIKTNFEDIYGDSYSDYIRFKQLPPENKVLIIDDIDLINQKDFEKYITGISDEFGLMIFASKNIIDLDMLDRMKTALKLEGNFNKYYIKPFFADKRKELINKLVTLFSKKDSSVDIESTVDTLYESIRLQKRFINLEPEFIINFVEYYCNNIGSTINSDSSVFSKVFESNITNLLNEHKTSSISVDKLYRLLSMLAHYIHFNKAYPISEEEIFEIVKKYNDEDDVIRPYEFLNIITNSKIIIFDGKGYKFNNRNHLAYFTAREVNFLYNSTNNETYLKYLLKYACFGINADILMFITYITDNPRILQLMLDMTNHFTDKWDEFDFDKNLPNFLKLTQYQKTSLPETTNSKAIETKEVENEKQIEKKLQTIDIYDYNEEESEEIFNQIIRSLSLLTVVSKCLPSFEHIMSKQMKADFVNMIYHLPNKIYNAWATETDKCYDELIDYLVEQNQADYHNQISLDKNDIIKKFQKAAISLLLDIYNIAAIYSTKENSLRLLYKFDSENQPTHEIEKLMILEKSKNAESFVEKAVSLSKTYDDILPRVMIDYIAKHAVIYMKTLDYKKREQLSSEFFNSEKEKRSLLIKRASRQKHEE